MIYKFFAGLLVSTQLIAGGVVGGSGGGIDLDPDDPGYFAGHQSGGGFIRLSIHNADMKILKEALRYRENVYSHQLQQEVVPLEAMIDRNNRVTVFARTLQGESINFVTK